MATTTEYAIGAGFNLAVASLTGVSSITQLNVDGRVRGPKTRPVEYFPTRVQTLSGKVYGDGNITHEWRFGVMLPSGLNYIQDTYLNGASSLRVSDAVTIQTRRHDREGWQRFNAYLNLPVAGEDFEYDSGYIVNLVLKFTGLIAF